MNCLNFSEISLKRRDCIKSLDSLQNVLRVDNEPLTVDSSVLFSRLIIRAERSNDPKPYFAYELAHEPISGMMRKNNKSLLGFKLNGDIKSSEKPNEVKFIIDGGALLHRIRWMLPCSYEVIVNQYLSYIEAHYGSPTILVFDGYDSGPSIKNEEQTRHCGKQLAKVS